MIKYFGNQKGSSLISLTAGALLIGMVGIYFMKGTFQGWKSSKTNLNSTIAEGYATELLEFFKSQSSEQLVKQMELNPVDPGQPPYPLCTNINFTQGSPPLIQNPDPFANLPDPSGLGAGAFRYYAVKIINIKTLQYRNDLCGNSIKNITLGEHDWFYVTVGVVWNEDKEERLFLSTVVPRQPVEMETTPIPSFSTGAGFNTTVRAIAPAIDISGDALGDIYVVGNFTQYNGTNINRIARLNPNGTLDATFAVGTGFNSQVMAITTPNDGTNDIVVTGDFTQYNGTTINRIARLMSNGQLRSTFAVAQGLNITGLAVAALVSGSSDVVVGGNFTQYQNSATNAGRTVRLTTTGARATSFALGSGFASTVSALLPLSDGKLYAGGNFYMYNNVSNINGIIRLNADGSRDTAFNLGAASPYGIDGGSVFSLSLADATSSVWVGGNFDRYRGTARQGIARILGNGDLETAFNPGNGFPGDVYSVVATADGGVYVGGTFTQYNNIGNINRLVHLTTTGGINGSFAVGSSMNGTVRTIAKARDGSTDIFVGGDFTQFQGVTNNRIIRIRANGAKR